MIKKAETFVILAGVAALGLTALIVVAKESRDGLSIEMVEGVEYSTLALIDDKDLAVLQSLSGEPRLYRAPMLDGDTPHRFFLRDGKAIPADPPPL